MQTTTSHPSKPTDVPACRLATEKLRQLEATESRLKSDKAALEGRLKQSREEVRDDALKALMGGADYQASLRSRREINDELVRVGEELPIVQSAIAEQKLVVSGAVAIASRACCAGVKPQHDAAVRASFLALIDATKEALIVNAIREGLDSVGVSLSSLPHLIFPEIGVSALEPFSRLSYLTKEALSLGLIERSDVPAEWLKLWRI
jgi:hypothetical protein